MQTVAKPRVYISYSWHTPGMKERVFELAEKLRAAGVDSRIDLYYGKSLHGFVPPDARLGDNRPPWRIWQEDQIRNAHFVLLVCSCEYAESPPHSGAWWDMHFMTKALESKHTKRRKFIPIGFGSYAQNAQYTPSFLSGEHYYDLSSGEGFGFEDLLRRIKNEFQTRPQKRPSTDVAILTILPEEYEAVCDKIKNLQPPPPRRNHPNLYAWRVGTVTQGDSAYSVAVGMMSRAGTIESALATRDAVERWNPRYIFFVGIAGGLKDVSKGDVVIADVIHGYEYGKIEKTFTPRSNWTYKTDIGLLSGAVAHARSNWEALIQVEPPVKTSIKVTQGEIASGDKVVDDPSNQFFVDVIQAWPKIIAVEMEGAGAGNAIEHVHALGKPVSYMMIRGISDLPRPAQASEQADQIRGTEERDAWKKYAADTAAAFTMSFISSGLPLPPR